MITSDMALRDISPNWAGSTEVEKRILNKIMRHEGTNRAALEFNRLCHKLGDYWYWFTLGTLWVHYSGFVDLNLWRRLFSSPRSGRDSSLMKPSELRAFHKLPDIFTAYRAHRPEETDWISYTIDPALALRWSETRDGDIGVYELQRDSCLAYFQRRGESEILCLSKVKP